jgi:predicted RecB family endonuclease
MRTTITINDKLYKTLKKQAIDSGVTVSVLVEDAVKYQLLEDLHDLKIMKERENEPVTNFDDFVEELKADGLL